MVFPVVMYECESWTIKKAECWVLWNYFFLYLCIIVVQSLSHVWLFANPWTAACQSSLSFTVSEFAQTHVHWVCDAIQPSQPPFSCPQSFLVLGSFPMSHLFTSGGQSMGASASASVLPMNIQDWFPLVWTGWISLQSKGLSRVFSSTTVQKYQFFSTQPSLWSNSHIQTWLWEKS